MFHRPSGNSLRSLPSLRLIQFLLAAQGSTNVNNCPAAPKHEGPSPSGVRHPAKWPVLFSGRRQRFKICAPGFLAPRHLSRQSEAAADGNRLRDIKFSAGAPSSQFQPQITQTPNRNFRQSLFHFHPISRPARFKPTHCLAYYGVSVSETVAETPAAATRWKMSIPVESALND